MDDREPAIGPSSFSDFGQHVHSDLALQARLRAVSEIDAFVALVVQVGRESGFGFAAEDVTAALKRGQTTWLTNWSPVL
jgi:hypothetical protein